MKMTGRALVGVVAFVCLLGATGCGPQVWQAAVVKPHVIWTFTQWEYVPKMGDAAQYLMEVKIIAADPGHLVMDLTAGVDIQDSSTASDSPVSSSGFSLPWGKLYEVQCPVPGGPRATLWHWDALTNLGVFMLPQVLESRGTGYTGRHHACPCVPFLTGYVSVSFGGSYSVNGVPQSGFGSYTMEIRSM